MSNHKVDSKGAVSVDLQMPSKSKEELAAKFSGYRSEERSSTAQPFARGQYVAYLAGYAAGLESPEVKGLVEALKFYSSKPKEEIEGQIEWHPYVCDSYSGLQYHPDWNGDLQDEPGEIAQKALQAFQSKIGGAG